LQEALLAAPGKAALALGQIAGERMLVKDSGQSHRIIVTAAEQPSIKAASRDNQQ
jgi:hypothetical protein